MFTIKVIFDDGLISDLQTPQQLKELKAKIVDRGYIERFGHVEIDDIKVGFGIGWVKQTVDYGGL